MSQVQSSHYRRKAIEDRATKIKTPKFNSGGLFQLFTKISTHENNLLYGKCFKIIIDMGCTCIIILVFLIEADQRNRKTSILVV